MTHIRLPIIYMNDRILSMDQSLDLQIAVLIFLGGTKNLVSEKEHGGAERMIEDEEIESDPSKTHTFGNTRSFGFTASLSRLGFSKICQTVV